MDVKIESLFKLAGNSNSYQFKLLILTFLIWVNLNILGISIGFLEKSPEVTYYDSNHDKYVNSSLNSTICEWKNNYTIIKNYTHSIITTFDKDCDPLSIGLLGSSIFMGNLVGSFIFQYVVDRYGRRKTVIIFFIPYLLSLLLAAVAPNIILLYIILCFSDLFAVSLSFSTYLLSTEITSSKYRSIFGSLINSAFGICGILYTIYYEYIGNWRYVFALCCFSNIIFLLCFIFTSYESPRLYLTKKDFTNFIVYLKKIAKANGKLLNFETRITEENNYYKECYDYVKLQTNKFAQDSINTNSETNYQENLIKDPYQVDASDNYNYSSGSEKEENNNKIFLDLDANEEAVSDSLPAKIYNDKNHKNKNKLKNKKFTMLDFFKYRSIRYKFLSLCFIWMTSSGCYYGLSINLKNLAGDVYMNGIMNYLFEIIIYIVSGYLINLKYFGRKNTMIIFYLISNVGFILYIYFKFDATITNFILFAARLGVAANYVILFTYTLEILPSPARAKGFGVNNAVSKISPVIFPVLLEIFPKAIFYVFLIMNLICLVLLIFFLPETLGQPLKELIEEDEKLLKIEADKDEKMSDEDF